MKIKTLCLFLVSLFLAAPSLAEHTKGREIDWAKELQLSAKQRQQILEIEGQYRKELQALDNGLCHSDDAKQAKQQALQQAMSKDLQTILSDEQTRVAGEVLNRHHDDLQMRVAKELAHKLDMTEAQRNSFYLALEDEAIIFTWPMDMQQHERDQEHFFSVLEQHLSAEQKKKWEEERSQPWHRFDELKPGCLLH